MGIREEIEGLPAKPFWDNYAETHRLFLEKKDVLSILDENEWECIFVGHRISEVYGENVWQPKGEGLEAGMDTILVKRGVEPGDRIVIYRRKNESSS